jgi:hypothetical protein
MHAAVQGGVRSARHQAHDLTLVVDEGRCAACHALWCGRRGTIVARRATRSTTSTSSARQVRDAPEILGVRAETIYIYKVAEDLL